MCGYMSHEGIIVIAGMSSQFYTLRIDNIKQLRYQIKFIQFIIAQMLSSNVISSRILLFN